jgi:RNA polymerase sigma-70 factor (ECF subfamily)
MLHNGRELRRTTGLPAVRPAAPAPGTSFPGVLQAARAGAEWAWSSIYRDLSPLVLGYLRAQRAAEPEDLTGEVCLQVVRDLHRFEGDERDFRAWVFTIVRHRAVDAGRRRSRRPVELAAEVPVVVDQSADVETQVLDRVGESRVREIIGQLRPDQRDVLLLRVLADLTVEETARVVGKSPGAVKALQRRGLSAIDRALAKEGVTL